MKIGILAPIVIPILGREQRYGGIETVISLAADELVKMGHDVSLYASGDSKTTARLIPVVDKAIGQDGPRHTEKEINKGAYKLALKNNPDVIWDHTLASHSHNTIQQSIADFVFQPRVILNPLELIDSGNIPVVHTLHGPAKDLSGNEQDGWHDGNFQDGLIQEARVQDEIRELVKIINNFQPIDPQNQHEIVNIGNKITLFFPASEQEIEVIIDGFPVFDNYISAESPLGAKIMGKKKGETTNFLVGGQEREVLIKEIFPPEI